MGMELEFNWYIVTNDNNVVDLDDQLALKERELSTKHTYSFKKSDYRVYPMETPLPLIHNGVCLALASIEQMNWGNNKTHLTVKPILIFDEGDLTAKYYEESFREYKNQQETIDDGGKMDVRFLVNARERVRV